MKSRVKLWILFVLLSLVAAGQAIYGLAHRNDHIPSTLYLHYKDDPHIQASWIENYRINDTVTVAATVLEATNDSAWQKLQEDFLIPPQDKRYEHIYNDSNNLTIKAINKKGPGIPMDTAVLTNNDMAAISFYWHRITIFEIENERLRRIIFTIKLLNKHYEEKNFNSDGTLRLDRSDSSKLPEK